MESTWEVSAGLTLLGFFVTVAVIPMVLGGNKILGGLVPLLQIPGWILTGIFALIAVVKFATRPQPTPDIAHAFTESIRKSAASSATATPKPNPHQTRWKDDALEEEWGQSTRRENATPSSDRPTHWSLGLLQHIEWKRFEELVAAYFRETGYRAETVRCGADGGVDAKIYKGDALISIVQCKSWTTRLVGVKPVRELLGVMAHQKVDSGIFFASGGFTSEAIAFAADNPLTLITGEEFLKTILALPEAAQQRLLAVATEGDYLAPSCPSCGTKMIKRDGSGGAFWGCLSFPRCRQTFVIAKA